MAGGLRRLGEPIGAQGKGVRWYMQSEIDSEYGASLSQLSLLGYDEDYEFPGDDAVFPGGYVQIANALASGLDIRTGQVVREIRHGQAGVTVLTDSGPVEADRAVVTLPLGVLKAGSVRFTPVASFLQAGRGQTSRDGASEQDRAQVRSGLLARQRLVRSAAVARIAVRRVLEPGEGERSADPGRPGRGGKGAQGRANVRLGGRGRGDAAS